MKRYKSRNKSHKQPKPQNQSLPTEPVEIKIESLSHDGRGVGRYDGKATFVSNALPGETVLALLNQAKSKFNEAVTTEIIDSSENRISPSCPHYEQCGGCDLQHLNPESQIALKQSQVLEQLQRIGQSTPEEILPPLRSAVTHYRRSARIGVNQLSDGEPIVGFRRRHSNLLCQIDNCEVLDARLENIFSTVRNKLQDSGDVKPITHIEIDLGDSGIAGNEGFMNVRLKKNISDEQKSIFQAIAEQYKLTLGFIGNEVEPAPPATDIGYQLGPDTLYFRSGDFIQVNAGINHQMVNLANELLEIKPGDRVLDLFCGLGNFSIPMARNGAQVTGIEGNSSMVQQAQLNAEHNKIEGCEFHCGNLAKELNGLHWYRKGYNKILLDPPRAGAATIIPQLTALTPEKVLYISCNPGALARDSRSFKEQGYTLKQFLVMDMFPQTHHLESMALFVKGKKPAKKPKLFSGKGHRGH